LLVTLRMSLSQKKERPSGRGRSSAKKVSNQARARKNLESSRRKRQIIALCLLLAAATFAVYVRVSGLSFVEYDDPDYVSRNLHVQAGLSWQTVSWALTATEAANWHPMTWLSHALDCQLYGLNPGAHHITSMVLHILNVLLLFLLLARATGLPGRSALVALLFALHPLNVESVAWVAER
jgi:protein O-mannosyl-transferase